MKNRKGLKHYLVFYVVIVVVYFIYISILAIRDGKYDPNMLVSIVYLPILFVGFMYLFDSLFDTFFGRKKRKQQKDDNTFFQDITKALTEQCEFSIEDFRRLRENNRFQKALHQAYKIKQEGETEEINFTLLSKKFKKNSREHQAMTVVIDEVKKMMSN